MVDLGFGEPVRQDKHAHGGNVRSHVDDIGQTRACLGCKTLREVRSWEAASAEQSPQQLCCAGSRAEYLQRHLQFGIFAHQVQKAELEGLGESGSTAVGRVHRESGVWTPRISTYCRSVVLRTHSSSTCIYNSVRTNRVELQHA